jgi:hypothetical protein
MEPNEEMRHRPTHDVRFASTPVATYPSARLLPLQPFTFAAGQHGCRAKQLALIAGPERANHTDCRAVIFVSKALFLHETRKVLLRFDGLLMRRVETHK